MLKGSKVIGQIARSYCVYPITISNWKKEFIEKAFRDIYGEGIMYGGEVNIRVWKALEVWFGASYFYKKGELTFTKEETKLKIVPIGAGIKYSFFFLKRLMLIERWA